MPSQRVKDALPREIIERIKASSQKSRTIAIIEPVHPSNSSSNQNAKNGQKCAESSNNNFNSMTASKNGGHLNAVGNSFSQSSNIVSAVPKPSIISKSHVIQPQQHHTRFAEAASSLNKSKHLRLFSR